MSFLKRRKQKITTEWSAIIWRDRVAHFTSLYLSSPQSRGSNRALSRPSGGEGRAPPRTGPRFSTGPQRKTSHSRCGRNQGSQREASRTRENMQPCCCEAAAQNYCRKEDSINICHWGEISETLWVESLRLRRYENIRTLHGTKTALDTIHFIHDVSLCWKRVIGQYTMAFLETKDSGMSLKNNTAGSAIKLRKQEHWRCVAAECLSRPISFSTWKKTKIKSNLRKSSTSSSHVSSTQIKSTLRIQSISSSDPSDDPPHNINHTGGIKTLRLFLLFGCEADF